MWGQQPSAVQPGKARHPFIVCHCDRSLSASDGVVESLP
jgi:hypothetical protein